MERWSGSPEETAARRENGVLFGSGLVGGEGLLGVVVAGVVFWQRISAEDPRQLIPLPFEIGHEWGGAIILQALALAAFAVLAFTFAGRCRAKS